MSLTRTILNLLIKFLATYDYIYRAPSLLQEYDLIEIVSPLYISLHPNISPNLSLVRALARDARKPEDLIVS